MSDQTRFMLNETDLPKFWYNVMADSPSHPLPFFVPIRWSRSHRIFYRFFSRWN